MYTYRDIKNYLKVNGWMHLLLVPLRTIQSKLFVIERGIVYNFIPANVPEKKPGQSIIVKRATINDLNKLRIIHPNTTLFREFLKNDDIFVIALFGEKIVGYVNFGKALPKRYKNFISLKPEELWHREAKIQPEYRNMGVYSMIFSFTAQIAERQGYSRVYSNIYSNNKKSIEIHTKKFGFNPVFSYTYIKFLFFEKTWVRFIKI
jgi:GNAT superfamily N-acetyltransferase